MPFVTTHMHEIRPRLWLGNKDAEAILLRDLQNLGITHILQVALISCQHCLKTALTARFALLLSSDLLPSLHNGYLFPSPLYCLGKRSSHQLILHKSSRLSPWGLNSLGFVRQHDCWRSHQNFTTFRWQD